MKHKKTIAWTLSLLLSLGSPKAALSEQARSLHSDNLVELQVAIERQEGLLFSLEDLQALTTLDPLPRESRLTTRMMGQDPGQDSLGACWGRCDDAHSICLDSLWFFPGLRCKMRRDSCRMNCALEDIDRLSP